MAQTRENEKGMKNLSETAGDKSKSAGDWATEKMENVKETASQFSETVGEKARDVARSVADTASRTKDRIGEWVGDAAEPVGEFVSDAYNYTRDATQELTSNLTMAIRKNPLAAVAIGFGVGMIFGRLILRPHSHV